MGRIVVSLPSSLSAFFTSQGSQTASKYAHVDTHVEELHATIQQLTQSKVCAESNSAVPWQASMSPLIFNPVYLRTHDCRSKAAFPFHHATSTCKPVQNSHLFYWQSSA